MPSLSDTLTLATYLHDGVDDATGTPYIEHPLWVMNHLPSDAHVDHRHLALMHDTVEDCKFKLGELMANEMRVSVSDPIGYLAFFRHRGYSPYLVDGLRLVTRDFWPDLTYLQWVREIVKSGHHGAIWVKFLDNSHNSSEERINRVLPQERTRVKNLQRRYCHSMQILKAAIDGFI